MGIAPATFGKHLHFVANHPGGSTDSEVLEHLLLSPDGTHRIINATRRFGCLKGYPPGYTPDFAAVTVFSCMDSINRLLPPATFAQPLRSSKMRNVSRRDLVLGASIGAVTIGTVGVGSHAAGAVPPPAKLWTLEGELKVHAKFVYRFFLVLLDGQKCALYGADHRREPEMLASLKAPVSVRVRGTLGTEHHSGGTQDNPSPFPAGWWVYMDVHEVEVLK